MLTTMDGRVPAIETAAPAAALDEPMCIFVALIDGLTSPERYTVEARDGELFIIPAQRSQRQPMRHPAPVGHAA